MAADTFFDRVLRVHPTSEGDVELPIRYRDVRVAIALFDVDGGAATELLAGTGLEPAIGRGGRAIAGLALYDYRVTSIGPYHEVGTAIFAQRIGDRARGGILDTLLPPARRKVGAHVVDLPVSTRAANAAGRELWGYPKFVTELPMQLGQRELYAAVRDPDGRGDVCAIRGRLGAWLPAPPLSLVTFSVREGALVRTHVDVRGRGRLHGAGTVRLEVGTSPHGMARRLRRLGLDGASPRAVLATERFQSLLHEGTVVG